MGKKYGAPAWEKKAAKAATSKRSIWLGAGVAAGVLVLFVVALLVAGGFQGIETKTETAAIGLSGDDLPLFGGTFEDPAVGSLAPTLTGVDFDSQPSLVKFDDGRPTMLVFGAHWCGFCQREFPHLVKWLNSGEAPADLRVVAVLTSTDKRQNNFPPSAWLNKIGWPADVIVDDGKGSAATSYGLSGFPFSVLVDANGTVVGRWAGEFADGDLERFVAPVVSQSAQP